MHALLTTSDWKGEEQEAARGWPGPCRKKSRYRPHIDTAVALVQDTEQDDDARDDVKDDATSPIAAIHLAHTG